MLLKKPTICLVSLLFSVPCFAAANTSSSVGIDNFHEVLPGKIYRGALPDASGIADLAKLGVKTVIDLQGGDKILGIPVEAGESSGDIKKEGDEVLRDGMQFISAPLSAIDPDFDDQAAKIDQIVEIVADPASQPVYFHCRHGSDRTGVIAALYRVLYQGCTPDQAHAEMLQDGHSSLLPWIDDYFYDRVKHDPRTQLTPGPNCPLPPAHQGS